MRPESRDALLAAIAKARGWIDDIRLGCIASSQGRDRLLGSHSSEWGALVLRPRPLGSKPQGLSSRAGIVTSPGGLPFSDFNRNHGQLSREEPARLRSPAANLSNYQLKGITMKRILLGSVASVFIIGSALAQQATPMPGMDMKGMDTKMMMPSPNDPPSTKGYKSAMMKMMEAMPKFTGDADIDFMKQMRTHHEAAIDMAKVVLANGKDVDTKKLAQEIIAAQEKEIAMIDAWLKKKGA